jgi:hypothetical protein
VSGHPAPVAPSNPDFHLCGLSSSGRIDVATPPGRTRSRFLATGVPPGTRVRRILADPTVPCSVAPYPDARPPAVSLDGARSTMLVRCIRASVCSTAVTDQPDCDRIDERLTGLAASARQRSSR